MFLKIYYYELQNHMVCHKIRIIGPTMAYKCSEKKFLKIYCVQAIAQIYPSEIDTVYIL